MSYAKSGQRLSSLAKAAPAALIAALSTSLLLGCGPEGATETGQKQQETIYGPDIGLTRNGSETTQDETELVRLFDDRRDVFDEQRPPPFTPPTRGWSWLRGYAQQAGVVLFHKSAFVTDPITQSPDEPVQFQGGTLGETRFSCNAGDPLCPSIGGEGTMCPGENFFFDPRPVSPTGHLASLCSGVLIDHDLIATAGHCVEPDRVAPRSCATHSDCDPIDNPNDPECSGNFCPNGVYTTSDEPCDEETNTCTACETNDNCIGPRKCINGTCTIDTIRDSIELSEIRVVFNYYKRWTDMLQSIKARDVFRPNQIAARAGSLPIDKFLRGPLEEDLAVDDYAILRIPRAVDAADGFIPVPVRQDRTDTAPFGVALDLNTPVGVIGAPMGIPMKLATDRVRVSHDPATPGEWTLRTFTAELDTFANNSGSGVFDLSTMTLAGIHVTGANDFVPYNGDPNSCWTSVYCRETSPNAACVSSTGARVLARQTHISRALRDLCFDDQGNPTFDNSLTLCAPQEDLFNNTCVTPTVIPVEPGEEKTLSGYTTNFTDISYLPSCDTSGSSQPRGNAYFQFTLDRPSIVYADTFESEFDTVLTLTTDCRSGVFSELECNDDNETFGNQDSDDCEGPNGKDTLKSRIQRRVGPGIYNLVVSGFGEARGRFQLHLQVLPDSEFSAEHIARGHHFLADGLTKSSDQIRPFCGADRPVPTGGKDIAYYYTTCPDYGGGLIDANTCNTVTTWDTVLSTRQGNRILEACSDDILTPSCPRQTDLSAAHDLDVQKFLTAGSGVRGLYIDGWGPNDHGFFQLEVTIP